MLKDLLYLVDAHAHVTNLAPALTQRVIETLVGELAHSLLQGFSQIQMMGIGAMLSVGFVRIMSLDYQLTSIFV
jgi:hypothetical protein